MLTLVLLASVLITVWLLTREYLSQTRRIRECGDKIPGPKPLPIIGNALEFGLSTKALFNYMVRLTKDYGPVARIWVGPRLVIVLADPSSVELLLGNTNNHDKSSLYDFLDPWVGQGLILNSGETWKRHRKLIAPTFQGPTLAQFVELFNSNLDVLVEVLSHHQNGPDFDIGPYMSLYTLDVICEFAMGVKLNAQIRSDTNYVEGVQCLEDVMPLRMFTPFLHPEILYKLSPPGRRQSKFLPIVLDTSKLLIEQRREMRTNNDAISDDEEEGGSKKKKAFLDYLFEHTEKGALTNEELEHEVNTILAAGHDTTAAGLSFTCWLLAKHQDVQEKVVAELRAIFGDSLRHATLQDLPEMKYLERVIKESLRMLPPVAAFGRKITKDITTDKYIFPAGSEVGVNVFMLHRHPDYFPDPEKFDPDRFLPENCVGRHPYCYIPFSGGPRICVGYKFAMHEMKITMAQLLRHFKIIPADNPFHDLNFALHVVMKSLSGVRVGLRPRNFAKQQ